MMDVLRIMSLLLWSSVLIFRAPSIWRVIRGRARFFDVLWSMIAAQGASVIGFNLRWFLPGDTTPMWAGLYVFSSLVAVSLLVVMARYGEAQK